MVRLVESAGGIVYCHDKDGNVSFLLIKRHALSGKIEWVAPKGKTQTGERPEEAALREVSEESGIPLNLLKIGANVGSARINGLQDKTGRFDKEITYFLMRYDGNPDLVDIQAVEGYLGIYKWASIFDVLNLVYYKEIRELFRKGYNVLKDKEKKNDVKQNFMKKLEL